ncbi:MAG: aldehyde ferredoxin oxidoreductase family protein [Myxococcota bacterium]|jgi:aldehyde:ferredoxin oxidoreductase
MSHGFTGTVLRVNLTTGSIEKQQFDEAFYRTYLGGGSVGTWFLLKETPARLDPFDAHNIITIAPSVTTGAAVTGASRCSVTALSPITGMIGDSQTGGEIGPSIKRSGYDAIVITGRAKNPCYLLVDGGDVQIRDAGKIAGLTVSDAHDAIIADIGKKDFSIIQCGPAGEKLVRFACLVADHADTCGRTGMGAVFGSKKLRAVAVRSSWNVSFADPKGFAALNKLAVERLKSPGFPATLREFGTPGVVKFQAESGNFATRNHSRGFHPEYLKLWGEQYSPLIGAGSDTCFGCVVRCRKKVKAEKPWKVEGRLGGPEFETLGLLGSNLEITDPVAVARSNELCNEFGMDTITMGGLAGYMMECAEKGLITADQIGRPLRFGDAEGVFWLIEQVGTRKGIGDVLAGGFRAAIRHFGEATAPYAVQVKNQGLPVHMPQVKPSQALMYAVCPIGPDHQSSEHDWLLGSGDDCLGLGIIGKGDKPSTGLPKVRMTVYSQYYYSLLDALCLCMFPWGPGNLFTYRELEDLVQFATGWRVTLWELMKAGERRVNMMRQLNARNGFTRAQDKLPDRLFEPFPDGPSAGRHVDRGEFARMQDDYYGFMGWDAATGNPTRGKLLELGLEWTIQ